MKLEQLTIRGLLRFTDTLSLDLGNLPEGLIAVVGENGSGKTAFLESALAAIYRKFASREKELVDYAHDRDSFIEAVFAFDGHGQFRARVNLDAVRRVSEAVLEQIHSDGTRAFLSDGKVSSFDAAVARVFPPAAVVLASAFAAQNRAGSFVTLDRRGRKELFSKLLGLEQYEQMAQTARTAAGLVEEAAKRLDVRRDLLARDTGADRDEALATAEADRGRERGILEGRRLSLRTSIADAEAALATVQDQVAACAVARQRVTSLEGELAGKQAEHYRVLERRGQVERALVAEREVIAAAQRKAHADIANAEARCGETFRAAVKAVEDSLAAKRKDLDARIANNRRILSDAEGIRAAVTRLGEVEASIATARQDEGTWRATLAEVARRRELAQHDLGVADQAARDLARASGDAQLIDDVPCQASGEYAGCQFLRQALAAKQRIPDLATKAARQTALRDQLQALAVDKEVAEQQLATIAQTIRDLEADKVTLAAKAKLEPALAAAEARIAELDAAREEAERAAERGHADAKERVKARLAELAEDRARADAGRLEAERVAELRADSQITECEQQLKVLDLSIRKVQEVLDAARADLAAAEAGNVQAQALQATLDGLRRQWDETTTALAHLEARRQEDERTRQALELRRADLADVERRIEALQAELLEWSMLAKALGRDGLPVLEIDAAGPTVSSYTNDLLSSCFGPRFSVELVTQEAKVSGKGLKESFEIKVYDNERGGDARDIADLSGGEQVIVEEALKNGIALFVNGRNTSPLQTCWRDETTGPLDPENAARYLPMLRRVQQLGGFHQVLFISHNPDAAAMADAQLRFADGRVTVALPPYGSEPHAA
jgi:exonuclease SbcC